MKREDRLIQTARTAKGVTRTTLADKISSSLRTVITIENGQRNPTFETILFREQKSGRIKAIRPLPSVCRYTLAVKISRRSFLVSSLAHNESMRILLLPTHLTQPGIHSHPASHLKLIGHIVCAYHLLPSILM
jgi:DNA-binding XRE family transcriptional regulator